MDLNEILTRERDSLRDENIELKKIVKELEGSINIHVYESFTPSLRDQMIIVM